MNENILIILAAGINTNASKHLFWDLKKELQRRYMKLGKTVKFVEVFPLGEVRNSTVVRQILKVGIHMHHGTGGKEVINAVQKYRHLSSKIILIGHSGGGQAVGDALVTLENKGIPIYHTIQIGAPSELIYKKYVHKVTRVQTKTDFVSRNIYSGTEAVTHNINPISGFVASIGDAINKGMPEIRYVDLNIEGQRWGGHSAYFKKRLINRHGIDNVTATVNAFWDKIV